MGQKQRGKKQKGLSPDLPKKKKKGKKGRRDLVRKPKQPEGDTRGKPASDS